MENEEPNKLWSIASNLKFKKVGRNKVFCKYFTFNKTWLVIIENKIKISYVYSLIVLIWIYKIAFCPYLLIFFWPSPTSSDVVKNDWLHGINCLIDMYYLCFKHFEL